MKNILSYEFGTKFTGSEIKSWILANLHNSDKEKRHMANRLKFFLNINDVDLYFLTLSLPEVDCWQVNKHCPYVVKVKK